MTERTFSDKLGDVLEDYQSRGNMNVQSRPWAAIFKGKRVFDFFLSLAAFVLLAPLFLLIAIAIKVDSRGPVFFSQIRFGYGNQKFRVFKFRTMHIDLGDFSGVAQARLNDPRVTTVGSFLRKTNLDEFPLLINVIKGELSLVGVRSQSTADLLKMTELAESDPNVEYWWEKRQSFPPGIVTPDKVLSFDGYLVSSAEVMTAELNYLASRSLWLDFSMFFKFVAAAFSAERSL